MAKAHKHQHTIPRVYLSSWLEPVTPPGQTAAIHRVSKIDRTSHRKSPEKSFTFNDRYTVHLRDGSRDLSVEKYLGTIESEYHGILRAIREKQNLGVTQRAKLAIFTAAMMGRSVAHSDHMRRQLDQLKELIEKGGSNKQTEEFAELLASHAGHYATTTIETTAPILFRMQPSILTTNDPTGFITSDNPAVMFNPNAYKLPPYYRAPGLAMIDIEISLPLSPRHLALYTHIRHLPLYQPLELKWVDELNRRTWFHADQEVVSKTGFVRDEWFKQSMMPKDGWTPENDPTATDVGQDGIPYADEFDTSAKYHDYWRKRTFLPPEMFDTPVSGRKWQIRETD